MKGIFLILSVWLAILVTNFSPNTLITGWDNLHPEFNLPVNIGRSIWAVWQEYQGLGLLGGMGHAADLPRQLLMLFLTRQEFFFLMLLIGPLGVYFLTKKNTFAALFYLLNLATIQTFFAPFEAFATHYGFLPWLIFAALSKNWWLFLIINLLAIPQAYIPTIFVVYLLILGMITIFKKSGKVLIFTLIINAFWLLPFGYFTLNNVKVPMEAKANQMATAEDLRRNQEFGYLPDVTILRGFWFKNFDLGSNSFMMIPWERHLQNPAILAVGYGFFGIILLGIIASFKQKHPYRWLYLGMFLLPFTLLLNSTPPFSWVDNLLYKVPLISQIFRFPYTKFSILMALMFSIYFGLGVGLLPRLKKITYVSLFLAMIIFLWPVFQGNLFYKSEKIAIPQEYFETIKFFNNQDKDTRIANFPQPSYWGWEYYKWGYQGSGFWWYGIEQPMLDRAFDVWSRENENYYWEISQALYSKNLPLFESVLNKYRVNWLLVDGNIINPSSPKALYVDELKELIKKSEQIKPIRQIGQIWIYEFNLKVPTKSFISLAQNLPNVGPSYKWGNLDQAYFDVGDYISIVDTKKSPYGDFQESANSSIKLGLTPNESIAENFKLSSGVWTAGESSPSDLGVNPNPEPFAAHAPNNGIINTFYYPYRTLFTGRSQADLEFDPNSFKRGGLLKVEDYPTLSHKDGYLITVKAKSDKRNLFWIEDLNSRRAVLETYLSKNINYFVLPPQEPDGLGYAFHADDIEKLEVFKIDYWGLVKQKMSSQRMLGSMQIDSGSGAGMTIEHPNPALYRVDLNLNRPSTLILFQSFDPGWIAFGAGEHILVNNWANGWKLTGNERLIYLFYWPQLLEFAGFGVLTIFIIGLIIKTGYSKWVLVIRN